MWDTGPGIAPEHQEFIFEDVRVPTCRPRRTNACRRSQRPRRPTRPSPWGEQGLGLGLTICKRIAEVLEARLTLRSELSRGKRVFGVVIQRQTLRHQHDLRSIARAELLHDGSHVRFFTVASVTLS